MKDLATPSPDGVGFRMPPSECPTKGFTEELLLRWGLMTLLVWAAWWLFQKGRGKPLMVYFICAIIASSIIFGLGHLPFVFALVPDASVALILYVIVDNFVFGLIVGYLYWKKGLESAMIAHMMVPL